MAHAKERRIPQRVELGGRAVVFERGDAVGHYDLQFVSSDGALIKGDHNLRRGHLVHILMDFALGDQPLSVTASVQKVRETDDGHHDFSLRFPVLSADQEDRIHDAILRALVRRRLEDRRPYLVFEPRRRVREEITAEITSFGFPVETARTLSEVVRILEDDEEEIVGLVVHSAMRDAATVEVIEFFAQQDKLRAILLPDHDGTVPERAAQLARLPSIRIPKIWSRAALRNALLN